MWLKNTRETVRNDIEFAIPHLVLANAANPARSCNACQEDRYLSELHTEGPNVGGRAGKGRIFEKGHQDAGVVSNRSGTGSAASKVCVGGESE